MAWAPGDLALCIVDDLWVDAFNRPAPGPARGSIHEVVDVEPHEGCGCENEGEEMLCFAPYGANAFWHGAFTKIDPLSDEEVRQFKVDIEHDERVTAGTQIIWYNGLIVDGSGNIHEWKPA